MPRTRQARVFFGNGEWDPRLWGRGDLPGYQGALALMENFFPTALGGARYRDGLRTRFVLPTQRDPARMKMVRAPGYLGAAERILVLDGTTGSGVIEAFAFPYEGNTRFTRTDLWTQSQSRVTPSQFTALSREIHRARVSFGDYAGTMLTHRSFAPLHIGSASITSTLLARSRVLLTIDRTTQHLWQLSRTAPGQSIDLGRMPAEFFNANAMTYFNGELLAIGVIQFGVLYANALWLVDRSNPRASQLLGVLNIRDSPVAGLATDGTTLYGCTRSNQIWNINRSITTACMLIGTLPASGSFTVESLTVDFTSHELTSMAYVNGTAYGISEAGSGGTSQFYSAVWEIDLATPANSTVATGIVSLVASHHPVSLSPYGSDLIAGRPASGSTRSDLIAVDLAGASTDIGDLPPALQVPAAMVSFDVQLNTTEQLGDLLDESTDRSSITTGANPYFAPKNYVDHLGNHQGEGAHPACSTVFLDRMIFAGSEYLPGTFIGSERYPRSAADLNIPDTEAQGALSYLFDGANGEAIATYNFYWLFYHPLKKALESWEQVDPQDSFSYKINAQRELAILWMVPYNNYLVLGTSEGVWIARDLDPDTPPEVTQYSNIPCADVDPVVTDFGIAYANASRKEIHFANLGVGFEPPVRQNAMAFARHLTEGTAIRQLAWQATPQRRLWMLTDDGRLAAWCFEPDANVLGWTRITNPLLRFCGVCVIPGPETELACVAAYVPTSSGGLSTIYMTTLDARDHLDLGEGIDVDIADDAFVPESGPGFIFTPIDLPQEDEDDLVETRFRVYIFNLVSVVQGSQTSLSATVTGNVPGPYTYAWSIISGPGTITGTGNIVTYQAPATVSVDTEVTVQVVATSGEQSASDDMTFTVTQAAEAKTVEARIVGGTSTDTEGEVDLRCDVYVDGTIVTNYTPWSFHWSVSAGGVLSSLSSRTVTVSASSARTLIVTCTASSPEGDDTDQHTIMVTQAATLTVSLSVAAFVESHVSSVNARATAGGTCSETIDYTWGITGGATIQENANDNSQAHIAGMVPGGSYEVTIVVRGCGKTAHASQSITVEADEVVPPPMADPLTVSISVTKNPVPTSTATVGGTATGPITYAWEWQVVSPAGVNLGDPLTFSTASVQGPPALSAGWRYDISLTVQRGGHSATSSTETLSF